MHIRHWDFQLLNHTLFLCVIGMRLKRAGSLCGDDSGGGGEKTKKCNVVLTLPRVPHSHAYGQFFFSSSQP